MTTLPMTTLHPPCRPVRRDSRCCCRHGCASPFGGREVWFCIVLFYSLLIIHIQVIIPFIGVGIRNQYVIVFLNFIYVLYFALYLFFYFPVYALILQKGVKCNMRQDATHRQAQRRAWRCMVSCKSQQQTISCRNKRPSTFRFLLRFLFRSLERSSSSSRLPYISPPHLVYPRSILIL